MRTFFICALPRSRTSWLANFLTWGPAFCFHEPVVGMSSVRELRALFESTGRELVGSSDCGNLYIADQLKAEFPGCQFVTVHRNLDECRQELMAMGLPDNGTLEDASSRLDRLSVDALRIEVADLSDPNQAEELCDYVGVPWDPLRFAMLSTLNVQPMPTWLSSQMTAKNAQSVADLIGAM